MDSIFEEKDNLMNHQFIEGVIFEWDKLDNDSYLKKIEAFKGIERPDFNSSITFFAGGKLL